MFCSGTMNKALRPFPERSGSRLLSPTPPVIRILTDISASQRQSSASRTRSKLGVLCKSAKRKKDSRHSRGAHRSNSLEADTIKPATSTEIAKLNEDISVEVASETRTAEAIALKIRAVEHMAVNNKAELKVLIEELENWQPCAASLRNSGIAHIFDDHTVWAGATLSERAFALRSKFLKTMRQNRRRGSSESAIPFGDASMRQFKQTWTPWRRSCKRRMSMPRTLASTEG
jgi:hypothetical protein